MCRIFGFRSVLDSQVHRSLLSAENALAVQSERHPDGWGVVYYTAGAPHVIKSTGTAATDALFRRVGGVVTSRTVLAHIRKATRGDLHPLNCHPFQYGRWTFAHNGDVADFPTIRESLVAKVAPALRRFILGDTDSEVVFFLFLTHLSLRTDLTRAGTPLGDVVAAMQSAVHDVRSLTDAHPDPTYLTFVVTDGELLAAHQGGKDLFVSTHKQRCPDRDRCAFFASSCESPPKPGAPVQHLVLSSEPLDGENLWDALAPGEIVGVDSRMHHLRAPADRPWPPVPAPRCDAAPDLR
jgi:glutamine amidotransferase